MDFVITHYGRNICDGKNLHLLPRIGEIMCINGYKFEVKDVIWYITNTMYVEIKVE